MTTPWSPLGASFLSDTEDELTGRWAIGQGPDAPDRQLFRALIRAMNTSVSVLEVGHGPGIEVEGLEQDGLLERIRYTGFDFTPELVAYCAHRWPNQSFAIADVETMKEQAIADVVWCRHTLEHVADGETALRNLWAATKDVLLISWFIRPTWCDEDVGCVEADGFMHWTYSAPRWIELCDELGYLYRFDIDHHLNRGSVWMISRHPADGLEGAAHGFLQSESFISSVLAVPPDPRERERDLLDILEDAHESLGRVIPAVPRVTDLLLVLREACETIDRMIPIADLVAGQDDDAGSNALDATRRARDARARVGAALGTHDPSAEHAAQAARDAQARIESALIENGRIIP